MVQSRQIISRWIAAAGVLAAVSVAVPSAAGARPAPPDPDGTPEPSASTPTESGEIDLADVSADRWIVQLAAPSVAEADATAGALDVAAPANVAYRNQLKARQSSFRQQLKRAAPSARVERSYQVVLNGKNLRIALRAIKGNALRSALAMLGIIIGIAAVIAMAAIGYGAQKQVTDRIRSLGTNVALVSPGSISANGVRSSVGSRVSLTEDDAHAIAAQLPEVVVAAPALMGTGHLIYGSQNWATIVGGVTPDYLVARDWFVGKGRAFTTDDVDNASKVVLLGTTVAKRLFEEQQAVGAVI